MARRTRNRAPLVYNGANAAHRAAARAVWERADAVKSNGAGVAEFQGEHAAAPIAGDVDLFTGAVHVPPAPAPAPDQLGLFD